MCLKVAPYLNSQGQLTYITAEKKTCSTEKKKSGMHKQLYCSRVSILRCTSYTLLDRDWAKGVPRHLSHGNGILGMREWKLFHLEYTCVRSPNSRARSGNRGDEGGWGRSPVSAVNEIRTQNHSFTYTANHKWARLYLSKSPDKVYQIIQSHCLEKKIALKKKILKPIKPHYHKQTLTVLFHRHCQ